jgi:RecA-family ATPase
METDSGFSGSTAWHNSVRSRLYLKGVRDEKIEPSTDMRVLEFKKNQYGPTADKIILRYNNGVFVPLAGTTADKERTSGPPRRLGTG